MRVLVARPQADAERTARRLAARGHEGIVAPVLRIERTDEPAPSGNYGAVILTSANGVPALASIMTRIGDVPIFAVGDRTGSAALGAGFKHVRIADGDARSLFALVKSSLPLGTVLLHVAGRERKPEPEASLSGAGFSVALWEAYAAVPAAHLPAAAERALRQERVDAALHYSRGSVGVLLGLVASAGVEAPFLALAHICLSDDTAAPLQQAGAKRLSVSDRRDEESLLAALDRFALK